MYSKIKSSIKDVFSVFFIAIVGLLVLQGFSERVDINLTDDTGYLTIGLRFLIPLAAFGPLYTWMFKFLKFFIQDTVMLYDVVMHLMYILPPVVAYVMMRVMGLKVVYALLISIGFMFSPNIMSFITWSKISHYTIMWVMLWVIFVYKKCKTPTSILFSLVVLTFLLGYIRPESHLSWYLSSLLFMGYHIWMNRKHQMALPYKRLALVTGGMGFFVFLTLFSFQKIVGIFNTLLNPMSGGRSNVAFAQQFSYNYCEWNNLSNFDWIQWRDIVKENFGEFSSLGEAFANNPNVFIQHVFYNVEQYALKFFIGLQSIFFPPSVFHFPTIVASVLFVLVIAARIFYVGPANWWNQFKSLCLKNIWLLISLFLIALPSVIASVVFYTREHYLLLVMPLVLFVLTLILLPKKLVVNRTPRIVTHLALPLVAVLIFAFKPSLEDYKTFDVWEEYTYPSNRKTIEYLRSLHIQDSIREVDYEGGFFIYVGKNYQWVNIFTKEEESYSEYVKVHQPNMYYVTKALLSNRFLTQDSVFMDIIQHPESNGFHKLELPEGNKGYLLIENSIQYQRP